MHTYISLYTLASYPLYLHTYMYAHSYLYLYTPMCTPLSTLHTPIYTALSAYIHVLISTRIHTYIHVCTCIVARYPIVLILVRARAWACIVTTIFSYSNYNF